MKQPASVHLQLTKNEANLLMLCYDSGVLGIANFNTMSQVCFNMKSNQENHTMMMENLMKLQKQLMDQIYKEKYSIQSVPSLILPKD